MLHLCACLVLMHLVLLSRFMLLNATLWLTVTHTFQSNRSNLADCSIGICITLRKCLCSLLTSNFINRDLRNFIYSKRAVAKDIASKDFPVAGMQRLYVNENLTQSRKRLLWQTKQAAKTRDYSYIWTQNGKIYVRKNENSDSVLINNESESRNL